MVGGSNGVGEGWREGRAQGGEQARGIAEAVAGWELAGRRL